MQGSISVALSWAGWGHGSPSSQRNTCSWISPLRDFTVIYFPHLIFVIVSFAPVDICHGVDDVRELELFQSCHLENKFRMWKSEILKSWVYWANLVVCKQAIFLVLNSLKVYKLIVLIQSTISRTFTCLYLLSHIFVFMKYIDFTDDLEIVW